MTFQPQHGWAIFDKSKGMIWTTLTGSKAKVDGLLIFSKLHASHWTAQQVVVISKEEFEKLKEDAWKYKELSK